MIHLKRNHNIITQTILCLSLFFAISASRVNAQYANSWIQYNQSYYKFAIAQDGVYRIPYTSLQNAGVPVGSINPRNIQVFGRGQEIPIFIQGEGDGIFDPTDYIEFVGLRNNAWLDTALYLNVEHHIAKGRSLFSDTSYYFITWNSSIGNLRYTSETDNAFSSFTPAIFYYADIEQEYSSSYYEGPIYGGGKLNPDFDIGEGWAQLYNSATTVSPGWIAPFLAYRATTYAGANATLWIHAITGNNPLGTAEHRHQLTFGGSVVMDTILDGYHAYKKTTSMPAGLVSAASSPFTLDFMSTFTSSVRSGISYVKIRLPQVYNLGGRSKQFLLIPDETSQSKARLDISNFNPGGGNVWLYDLTNRRRIHVYSGGPGYQSLIPNGSGIKTCYISAESQIQSVAVLRPVSAYPSSYARFLDYQNTFRDFDYLIVSPSVLRSSALAYKNYRQQTGFHSLQIDIEELYDQFAYGIPKHPMAIRNFLQMTLNEWTLKPEHLFLIGKGIRNTLVNPNAGNYATQYQSNLLPPIGVPPVDHLYGFRILDMDGESIAIGRLAANNNQQVFDYLNKVQQQEGNIPALWMKNILHLGGGGTLSEQLQLEGYLNGFKSIIEDSLFAGKVYTILKQSSQPMQLALADSVRKLINENGVSLITIFGHGSGQGFDQNIDEPQNYYNTGKYPVIIANSCLSGDIFQTVPLISEKFVFEPNKAAIAFIASPALGISSLMKILADSIYTNLSLHDYGQTIGFAIRNAISEVAQGTSFNSILRFTALEPQIHGDPGLRLNSWIKPDIAITQPDVRFIPALVTSELDSFEMEIVMHNLGRYVSSPVLLSVRRDFPRQGVPDTVYYFTRTGLFYSDTIRFKLPVNIVNSFGENIFTVTADPFAQIIEMNEMNNEVVAKLNILSSEIVPVYPFKFQVVPASSLFLKASTGDPFAALKKYKIQIDTTDLFNSPFLRDTIIEQTGGVVKWKPPFSFTDSTVYFWRTGVDSAQTGSFYRWKESSFQYIIGKYGWGQDHFFQFKDDAYLYIEDNRSTRTFEFVPNIKQLKCITYPVLQPGDCCQFNSEYSIDGAVQEEGTGPAPCGFNPGLYLAVIDPITLEPWGTRCAGQNPLNSFGNANDNCQCYARVSKYFFYNLNDGIQRAALENFITNIVPDGHFLLAYTNHTPPFYNPSFWPNSLVTAFENMGADTLRTLVDSAYSRSYIFFTRKGDNSTTLEAVGPTATQPAELIAYLQNDWMYGTITSPLIGPASRWGSFHWNTFSIDANPFNDSAFVNIIGVKPDGQQDILYGQVQPNVTSIPDLYNNIDASVYPYLKLFMFTRDDATLTPTQLDSWHVLYEGVPEAALNPSIQYSFYQDTLQQGDDLRLITAVENIGDYPMDSLWMHYFIIDKNNQIHHYYQKNDSLRVGTFIVDTFKTSTVSYPGLNSLWIEANPINHPSHQLEQTHFNNIGQKLFMVGTDKANPLLDVTFDGVHIMNGDIVSAKPDILIQLKDENQLLWMDDTSDVEIYLRKPGVSTPVKLHFSGSDLIFHPATNSENYCRIEYRPDFTNQDGMYELLLRATDKSGNMSGIGNGSYDYNIQFEVINQSTITHVLNYPNPFSTSTQFVFTLTGSELPTEFTIQILTISGIVVREITLNELGPIHIGRNITSFRWDGTDEYGDKLATGVYIYRVIARLNGESIERKQTTADKYFKNGFGKMYIMR